MNHNPRFGATLPLNLLKEHQTPYFFETGTSNCAGVETARQCGYERIYTVDIDYDCWNDARTRYANDKTVIPVWCDTSMWMPILALDKPTTFWLDAHDDGGPKGRKRCPILDELYYIGMSEIKGHVILVDDRRCFGSPEHWAPDIFEHQVREAILQINLNYKISIADSLSFPQDIIVATLSNELPCASI